MNATRTSEPSEPPSTLTVVVCTTFPLLLLLCICCVIFITAERGKPLPRATVVVPVDDLVSVRVPVGVLTDVEAVRKVVPPLP